MTRIKTLLERARSSFWVVPAGAIAVAIGAGMGLPAVDRAVDMPDALPIAADAETARAVVQLIATVGLSVAGISFSVIVVALVLASQQLSPRILRSFQRDPLNQVVLAVFLGTSAFSIFVLATIDDGTNRVPDLSVTVAMAMAAVSFTLFVVFLHHVVRSLNASAVIRRIAAEGHVAIEDPYPAGVGSPAEEDAVPAVAQRRRGREVCAPRAGYVASVEAMAILAAAEELDGFAEQKREIGSFVVTGGLLAVVWCADADADELARRVESAFVLDEERIVEADVAFPLRQLTDVALKGLSSGVNDPTTAENAMDSVTDSLVRVAREARPAPLRAGEDGCARFRALPMSLAALVRLGFEQVRHDAAPRPAFTVRLLELLAELRKHVGDDRDACLEIDRQARAAFADASEQADVDADAELLRDAFMRLHGDPSAAAVGAVSAPEATRAAPSG